MTQTMFLLLGDCRERSADLRKERGDGFLGAIVSDPPYDLTSGKGSTVGFMQKSWDSTGVSFDVKTWEEAYKALEPGGILKVFSATRTFHRMILSIEKAGFVDVRLEAWVQGEGFPKGLNISKKLEGLGESEEAKRYEGYNIFLKPSWEPIVIAVRPK